MKPVFILLFLLFTTKFTALAETKSPTLENIAGKFFVENATKPNDSPIDEYGTISWKDERARLDNAAIRLTDYKELKCLFLIYYKPQTKEKKIHLRIKRILKYLVETREIDAKRILFAVAEAEDNQRRTIILGYTEGAKLPINNEHQLIKGEDLSAKLFSNNTK